MSRNNSITAQLYDGLMNQDNRPVMNLQSYRKMADGYYSAVFASVRSSQEFRFEDFNSAVAEMTEDEFGILADSLYTIDGAHVPFYRCVLAGNMEVKTYTPDNMKGMIAVSANVFKDEGDNLWRLVGTGDKKHIVQNSADDFDGILEARRQRNAVVANYSPIAQYDDGDYACFFNQTTSSLDFGFLALAGNKIYALPRNNPAKPVQIQPDQIVEAALVENFGDKPGPAVWREKAEAAGGASIDAYLDYMRSLFGGTPYFKALEKAIRQNRVG